MYGYITSSHHHCTRDEFDWHYSLWVPSSLSASLLMLLFHHHIVLRLTLTYIKPTLNTRSCTHTHTHTDKQIGRTIYTWTQTLKALDLVFASFFFLWLIFFFLLLFLCFYLSFLYFLEVIHGLSWFFFISALCLCWFFFFVAFFPFISLVYFLCVRATARQFYSLIRLLFYTCFIAVFISTTACVCICVFVWEFTLQSSIVFLHFTRWTRRKK